MEGAVFWSKSQQCTTREGNHVVFGHGPDYDDSCAKQRQGGACHVADSIDRQCIKTQIATRCSTPLVGSYLDTVLSAERASHVISQDRRFEFVAGLGEHQLTNVGREPHIRRMDR